MSTSVVEFGAPIFRKGYERWEHPAFMECRQSAEILRWECLTFGQALRCLRMTAWTDGPDYRVHFCSLGWPVQAWAGLSRGAVNKT